jgi:hypothetical protein
MRVKQCGCAGLVAYVQTLSDISNSRLTAVFRKVKKKWIEIRFLKGVPKFSLREWKRGEMK